MYLKVVLELTILIIVNIIKAILKTFSGLAVSLSGLYVAYYYISNIEVSNPLIFVFSLILITAGIIFLIRIGKSGETIMVDSQKENLEEDQAKTKEKENFLEKNAKISAEWAESVDKKDKMESLKIAAAVEEEQNQ
jgi:hypothetical protein